MATGLSHGYANGFPLLPSRQSCAMSEQWPNVRAITEQACTNVQAITEQWKSNECRLFYIIHIIITFLRWMRYDSLVAMILIIANLNHFY